MKRAFLFAALLAALAPVLAAEPDIDAGAVFLVPKDELAAPPYRGTVAVVAPAPWGGHIGIVLNRPTKHSMAELFHDHAPSRAVRDKVYFGGAYRVEAVAAVIQAPEKPAAGSLELMPGVWLVLDMDAIDEIIANRPNDARYYAGSVLWTPRRLRFEIERGVHTVLPADASKLFLPDTSKLRDELVPDDAGKSSVPLDPRSLRLRI